MNKVTLIAIVAAALIVAGLLYLTSRKHTEVHGIVHARQSAAAQQ